MRELIAIGIGVLGLATGAGAQAQGPPSPGSPWSGPYLGVDVARVGGRDREIKATIDPARDSRFTYIQGPTGQTLSIIDDLPRETGPAVRAGALFQSGSLVWGVEGQLGGLGLAHAFSIGPVDAGPTTAVPRPGMASPTRTIDSLSAALDIDTVGALRGRVGIAVGDRALVSLFAGPSLARARLTLTQRSAIEAFVCDNHPVRPGPCFTISTEVTNTGPTKDERLRGVVGGGAVDLMLDDRWILHTEIGVGRYGQIEARSGGTSGGDSRFSYKPELYSVAMGLTYRF